LNLIAPDGKIPNSKHQTCGKHQIPNNKSQINSKSQKPNSKKQPVLGIWYLKFVIYLFFGIWGLEFPSQELEFVIWNFHSIQTI
jgi:hypothetical protein